MYLVTNKRGKETFLVKYENSSKSLCGVRKPKNGWVILEHNADTVSRLSEGSKEAYEKLPRKYFITLGAPLTYKGVPELDVNNRKTGKFINMTIPKGTEMFVVWRQDGLTYCNYGGKLVMVGRNSAHKFTVEVVLNDENAGQPDKHADDNRELPANAEEHAAY